MCVLEGVHSCVHERRGLAKVAFMDMPRIVVQLACCTLADGSCTVHSKWLLQVLCDILRSTCHMLASARPALPQLSRLHAVLLFSVIWRCQVHRFVEWLCNQSTEI
jgi:hypothetical protein